MGRFGVFFDGGGGSGWACEYGFQPYFAASVGDLGSNVVYLTNLRSNDIQKAVAGFGVDLKSLDYLGLSLTEIILELSLEGKSQKEVVFSLSKVFRNYMYFGSAISAINSFYKKSYSMEISCKYHFKHDYAFHEIENYTPKISRYRLSESLNLMSKPVTVYIDRFSFYEKVSSLKIPSGKLELVNLKNGQSFIDFMSENEREYLLKVSIKNLSKDLAFIVDYSDVCWVTSMEWRFLSGLCDIEIIEIYQFQYHQPLNLFESDLGEYSGASYSLGLYLRSVWDSFKMSEGGGKDGVFSTTEIWIESFDRIKSLELAASIVEEFGNVDISYLSGGKITFSCGDLSEINFNKFVVGHDLIPHASNKTIHPATRAPSNLTSAGIIREIMNRGSLSFIHAIDDKAIEEAKDYNKISTNNQHMPSTAGL